MSLKIYFCGSVAGGREDAEIYATLIEHLKQYGTVLTEHLGRQDIDEYEAELDTQGMELDTFICERDKEWLAGADRVVAEVSMPSHGVGIELAYADLAWKSILCLYREGSPKHLSPLINGEGNFIVKRYTTVEEATDIIDAFFKKE